MKFVLILLSLLNVMKKELSQTLRDRLRAGAGNPGPGRPSDRRGRRRRSLRQRSGR